MGKISKLYKSLSDNQRYNFWSAATNLFLCMFTFWLGITIQFIVVDKTIDYQSQNAYLKYWEYIGSDYQNLLITSNFIGESALNQKMFNMLEKNDKLELSKEQINIINKFDSNYEEIMSNVDQFTESAVSLAYAQPNIETSKQILGFVYKIEVGKIMIKAIRNNIHIDSLKSAIDEYHKSDEYIIANRTFNAFIRKDDNVVEELCENVKEIHYLIGDNIYIEKYISYHLFLSSICDNVLKICQVCENEFFGLHTKKWWNGLSLFYKSLFVLICTIVIGYFISRWFLRKLALPSDPNRDYTAEEYKKIKKQRDCVCKIFENQNEIKRLRGEIIENNMSLRKVYKHVDEIRLLEKLQKDKDVEIKRLEEEIKRLEEEINNINK